jgi:hypothetical protein
MVIPKEIVEKMEQANALILEIDKWIYDNIDYQHIEDTKYDHSIGISGDIDGKFYNEGDFYSEDYFPLKDETFFTEEDPHLYEKHDDGEFYAENYHGFPTETGNYFFISRFD